MIREAFLRPVLFCYRCCCFLRFFRLLLSFQLGNSRSLSKLRKAIIVELLQSNKKTIVKQRIHKVA